jgi:hypothetical protein
MRSAADKSIDLHEHLSEFTFSEKSNLFSLDKNTVVDSKEINNEIIVKTYTNEFWTSKQRQASSLHEISYRACFKPQLPRFFIEFLTEPGDIVYDPFSGRGTTIIEAALLNRNVISNDINPLSRIFCRPRLFIPDLQEVNNRLNKIEIKKLSTDINLDMFFHEETLDEILSIRKYLAEKTADGKNDNVDDWIRMVATNRLTGHSTGFFSVYTLPPNQAVLPERQKLINEKRKQIPEYRNTRQIILEKSKNLIKDISTKKTVEISRIGANALFIETDAGETFLIKDDSVKLTVTSPPFLDVVQYSDDNWMRSWFNNIDADTVGQNMTVTRKIVEWNYIMGLVFKELYRITTNNGYVAFEVGDVKSGKVCLDDHIVKIGIDSGFECLGIMINQQNFTKTANIWGISNNKKGTNTNRIVMFRKG